MIDFAWDPAKVSNCSSGPYHGNHLCGVKYGIQKNCSDNTQESLPMASGQLPELTWCKNSPTSVVHWVQQGLPVICCNALTEVWCPCEMRQRYSDWRRTICYAVRHCRLACHMYNANTSLGTHAKCMVIGTPSKDYRTHCFVEVLLRPLKGKHL